jgi:hypothetical protein
MKLENFRLVEINNQQIIEIDYQGEIYDLHNAAELLRIDFVLKTSMLTLFWQYYFDENNIVPFQIRFENINYLEILPRDSDMPKGEDDCLEEIVSGENIEFKFMGGMRIVVNAENVSFEINE